MAPFGRKRSGREADAFRDLRDRNSRKRISVLLRAVLLPAPEHGRRADGLGYEAEDADREEPQTEVPHLIQDRTQAAPS